MLSIFRSPGFQLYHPFLYQNRKPPHLSRDNIEESHHNEKWIHGLPASGRSGRCESVRYAFLPGNPNNDYATLLRAHHTNYNKLRCSTPLTTQYGRLASGMHIKENNRGKLHRIIVTATTPPGCDVWSQRMEDVIFLLDGARIFLTSFQSVVLCSCWWKLVYKPLKTFNI